MDNQEVGALEPEDKQEVTDSVPVSFASGSQKYPRARITHFRKRYSDGRTTEGKYIRSVIKSLADDLGGIANLSPGQRLIMDRLREKIVTVVQIAKFVDRQPSIITDSGELLPCLGRGYTTYAESIRRDLQALYELADRRPSRVPSLDDYLKQAKTVEHSEAKP